MGIESIFFVKVCVPEDLKDFQNLEDQKDENLEKKKFLSMCASPGFGGLERWEFGIKEIGEMELKEYLCQGLRS